tara:strand:+ start:40 stop:435 length:396 start_codon:yes stop_codon:yes gene_type:complete
VTSIEARPYLILLVFIIQPLIGATQQASQNPQIDQNLGVDQSVDYTALVNFGPWDDRNYKLTTDDLSYLSANEAELRDPIPAFFRVELRKEMPDLPKTGPAQYPRSAVQLFQIRHGGLVQQHKTIHIKQKE